MTSASMRQSGGGPAVLHHAILAASYLTQGIVYGFAAFILIPTLAARGVSLEQQTGILALAGVPWIFKVLWAPLLDRVAPRGRGPRWALAVGMAAVGCCILGFSTIDQPESSVRAIAILWLAINVALSLQDVATDALALDVVAPQRRGVANGLMLGGHHVGMNLVGGWALGLAIASQGWTSALSTIGVSVLLLGVVFVVAPTAPSAAAVRGTGLELSYDRIAALLRNPGAWLTAAIAALVLFADAGTSAVASEFLVGRLQWSVERIYGVLPIVVGLSSLLAYGVAAAVVDRVGHTRAAVVGSAGMAAVWGAYGLAEAWWHIDAVLFTMIAAQTLVTALLYVGMHAALMDRCDPALRATHFALLMAALNLPRVVAPGVAASVVSGWGWPATFLAAGAYQLVIAVVLRVWSARDPVPEGSQGVMDSSGSG